MYYALLKKGDEAYMNKQKLEIYEYTNQKSISNVTFIELRPNNQAQLKRLDVPHGATLLFVDLNLFGNSIQEVTACFKILNTQGLHLVSVNRPELAEFLIQNSDILNSATSYFEQTPSRPNPYQPTKAAHNYNDYLDRIKEFAHQGKNPRQIWESLGCVGTFRGFAVYCTKKRDVKEILQRYGH